MKSNPVKSLPKSYRLWVDRAWDSNSSGSAQELLSPPTWRQPDAQILRNDLNRLPNMQQSKMYQDF